MGVKAPSTALAIRMDTLGHFMAIMVECQVVVLMLMMLSFLSFMIRKFEVLAGCMCYSSALFFTLAKHVASSALTADL